MRRPSMRAGGRVNWRTGERSRHTGVRHPANAGSKFQLIMDARLRWHDEIPANRRTGSGVADILVVIDGATGTPVRLSLPVRLQPSPQPGRRTRCAGLSDPVAYTLIAPLMDPAMPPLQRR